MGLKSLIDQAAELEGGYAYGFPHDADRDFLIKIGKRRLVAQAIGGSILLGGMAAYVIADFTPSQPHHTQSAHHAEMPVRSDPTPPFVIVRNSAGP